MIKSTLGDVVTTHTAVGGSAEIFLGKHRTENRMTPLLRYRTRSGAEHVVELSTEDVVSVMESLVILHSAEQPQITEWWKALTGHDITGSR
jgi:hypothetical protein